MRGWAKLQMLATQPEYSGKLRTYINNMQNAGEEDQAARNAFDMNAAKLAAQAAVRKRVDRRSVFICKSPGGYLTTRTSSEVEPPPCEMTSGMDRPSGTECGTVALI